MDPIKPNFIVVGKRCFRAFYSGFVGDYNGVYDEEAIDESTAVVDEFEEEINEGQALEDLDFEQDQAGTFSLSMVIPSEFYGMIIGFKGQNLNKLEFSTRCRIILPKKDSLSNNDLVVLKSISKRNILSARRKLLAIVDRSRSRLEPNYFISIPLNDEELIERFEQFKRQVLSEAKKNPLKYKGIEEDIFQDPNRLHLTICMLLILNQTNEKNHVIKVLENLYRTKIRDVVKGKTIRVRIKGLAYMNDDDQAVDVLYGKIEPHEDLQKIVEMVVDEFKNTLFISRERAKVLLHLTLLNSKFALNKKEREGWLKDRKNDRRNKFNIKELVNKFGDYDFGEVEIKSIELSIRHTKSESGYYNSAYSMPLLEVT